ncbi:hypothetical protein QNI16_25265 [Cytophagaceae bacterium YF14B1]|uniref:Uncharacterized protein n=1 Tax=Xanthocytophaga flava TaxID=3048013 RepID=A0AAE3QV40_9BACT|nr:hypothetical protein [Xanthocytophaga flavus]MDJ1483835.1 hypothetical protein [Xanthocytophaga flavus]
MKSMSCKGFFIAIGLVLAFLHGICQNEYQLARKQSASKSARTLNFGNGINLQASY